MCQVFEEEKINRKVSEALDVAPGTLRHFGKGARRYKCVSFTKFPEPDITPPPRAPNKRDLAEHSSMPCKGRSRALVFEIRFSMVQRADSAYSQATVGEREDHTEMLGHVDWQFSPTSTALVRHTP